MILLFANYRLLKHKEGLFIFELSECLSNYKIKSSDNLIIMGDVNLDLLQKVPYQ